MTRQSIGSEAPENLADADKSGAPDRAERDFEADGARQPSGSDARPARPHRDHGKAQEPVDGEGDAGGDDRGLESTREHRGTVVPPASS